MSTARYYTATRAEGTPLGYALMTEQELGLFMSRHCSFGRSVLVRELRASDAAAVGAVDQGRAHRGKSTELAPSPAAASLPTYRAWHRIVLEKSRLDSLHRGSIGWWYVSPEVARELAFSCVPAHVEDSRGAIIYRGTG